MRQSLAPSPRPVGVTGQGVPVIGFGHVPGLAPVAVARIPDDARLVGPAASGTHAHDFLVLFYAHRADGRVLIDGRAWTVRDGDLFVIAPRQVVSLDDPHGKLDDPHGELHDPHQEIATDGWVVWFPADVVRPGMAGAYSSWRAHPLLFPFARGTDREQRLHIPAADRAEWVERFAALDAELRARRDGHQEAALAHLTLLLVAVTRLSTGVADQLRSSDEPLLAAVFDTIEERYQEPISLADVAAALALTPGHLTTLVRRKTGRTVQQWITQRRMQQARRLLTETDAAVAVISRRVGYPDVSYFIKRFRAEHGVTPGQWRDAAHPAEPAPAAAGASVF